MEVSDLTPEFTVLNYSGGNQSGTKDAFSIDKALDGIPDSKHCSQKGFNFDLLLEFKNEEGFTMTHFAAMGATRCTAPLKNGVMFVVNTPSYEEFGELFNDCSSEEEFQRIKAGCPACAELPGLYFETDPVVFYYASRFHAKGKYVYVKFIRPHDDANVDVGAICIVGVPGSTDDEGPEEIPESLANCIRKRPFGAMRFDGDLDETMPKLQSSFGKVPYCFAVTTDDAEKDYLMAILDEISNRPEFKFRLMGAVMGQQEGTICARLRDMMKIESLCTSAESTFLLGFDDGKKYFLQGEPEARFDANAVAEFARGILSGESPKFCSSAPRPEGDADPEHPGITILVASSFDELVIAEDTPDAFVDVYADWCPPCKKLAPHIAIVGEVLAEEEVRVCKFDGDVNDTPREFFPEKHIPILKFFPKTDKLHPIPYEGDRDALSIIRFIHEHAITKFELEPAIERADRLLTQLRALATLIELTSDFMADFKEANDVEFEGKGELTVLQGQLVEIFERRSEMTTEAATARFGEFDSEVAELHGVAEKIRLKNVVKVHTLGELDAAVDGAEPTKLVVVDLFAAWCPPCRRIAPVYADFSVQFADVLFLKIDFDKAEGIRDATRYQLKAFPTFKFFKGGKMLDEFSGANPDRLAKKIVELQ